ncbi:unnamed protein product [Ilex paraguariensis]|uniref:SAP domain-containing protein n=1 Tax=Ilex paraguariensis TaxID=185542 RepID=A0ABC8U313_9AQUA
MSSPYPILDNRPINKWKVAELKEELKRRNLTTKGLKDDLVRRLDEAICNESGNFKAEVSKDFVYEPEPMSKNLGVQLHPSDTEMGEDHQNPAGNTTSEVEDDVAGVDDDDVPADLDQGKVLEMVATEGTNSVLMVGEPALVEASMEISSTVEEFAATQISTSEGALENNKIRMDNEILKSPQKDTVLVGEPGVLEATLESNSIAKDIVVSQIASDVKTFENEKIRMDNEGLQSSLVGTFPVGESAVSEASVEASSTADHITAMQIAYSDKVPEIDEFISEEEGSKPLQTDAAHDVPDCSNQVYEVSPSLGFQVKSESILNDTMSNYETKELKGNLNADNVHLELEVVKPEMVQPSSGEVPPNDGILHPLDAQMPHRNLGFCEETDDAKPVHVDFSHKNDSANHYSVDVSVMEDDLENKAFNLVGGNSELTEVPIAKNGSPGDAVKPDLSPGKMETSAEEKFGIAASSEERKLQDCRDTDFSKSATVADGEQMEKINLDQSSGDDSIEEDVMETRHVDSDHNSDKGGERTGLIEAPRVQVVDSVDAVQPELASDKLKHSPENKENVADFSEKRKFQDGAAVGNKEPPKRQRKWNSESLKIPEPQDSSASLSTPTKDLISNAGLKRSISRSSSTLGADAPKERVVPPSPKTPTNSIRINNFLRPFTLKAVQDLLSKTGNVCSFWMDHIKTHCYVTYSSVEEAIESRNAVYNLQWPPNGGRLLVAEFVDPQEVKLRLEAPPQSAAAPVVTSPTAPPPPQPPLQLLPSASQPSIGQPLPPQGALPPAPPTSGQPAREKRPLPLSPSLPEKIEPPIVTLDDLFRKTRATPRIYYLPLTEEQVAAKLAKQRKDKQ